MRFRLATLALAGLALANMLGIISPGPAFLMVSRVRYPSFKAFDLRKRRPYGAIILMGILVYAIWRFSEYSLMTLATVYAFSGPVSFFISKIRPHPPAPEEVHAS